MCYAAGLPTVVLILLIFAIAYLSPPCALSVRKIVKSDCVLLKYNKNEYFTLLIISHQNLLKMRDVSDKGCRESQNTHFMFSNVFQNIVLVMR